jgi:hypothetical protein
MLLKKLAQHYNSGLTRQRKAAPFMLQLSPNWKKLQLSFVFIIQRSRRLRQTGLHFLHQPKRL